MSVRDHLDEAKDALNRCCGPEDAAFALAAWMDSAAQFHRNEVFYRELLIRCGNVLGPEARTDDTGQVHPDVFVSKVPEILENRPYPDADGCVWIVQSTRPEACPFCNGKGVWKWHADGHSSFSSCRACRGGKVWFRLCKPPVQPKSAGTPAPAGV